MIPQTEDVLLEVETTLEEKEEMVNVLPAGMLVDENDINSLNTQDWTIHDLQSPIHCKRVVNMPWVTIAGNLYYESGPGDIDPVQYQFPYITNANNNAWYKESITGADAKEQIKVVQRRADNMKDRSGKQQLVKEGKLFGEPLKEFLIKPVPYSDLLNNPILYSIEFYTTYKIDVSVRST